MSNLKSRLLRLEESRAAQTGQQVAYDSEETRQWLNDIIQSINDGTYIPEPKTPRKPLPPDASPTAIWLDEILNEME